MSKYTIEEHLSDLENSIINAKSSGLKLDAIIIGTHCCPECDKIDKLTLPLDTIIKEPILPYSLCTRKPFCICCYGFIPLRDDNNKQITQ